LGEIEAGFDQVFPEGDPDDCDPEKGGVQDASEEGFIGLLFRVPEELS